MKKRPQKGDAFSNQVFRSFFFDFRSLKPFEVVLEDDYLSCGPSEFNPSSCVICLKRVKDASLVCPQCNIPVCDLEVSL